MCGIIGTIVCDNPERVKDDILQIFEFQKSRGIKGFGISITKNERSLAANPQIMRERTITLDEIEKSDLWNQIEKGDIVIFHHRISTSTPNTPECNHPIMNESQDLVLAHNGHIYDTAFKDLTLDDLHDFETIVCTYTYTKNGEREIDYSEKFTDSELAVHFLEDEIKTTDKGNAILALMDKLSARNAFLVSFQGDNRLWFASKEQDLGFFEAASGNTYVCSSGYDMNLQYYNGKSREKRDKAKSKKKKKAAQKQYTDDLAKNRDKAARYDLKDVIGFLDNDKVIPFHKIIPAWKKHMPKAAAPTKAVQKTNYGNGGIDWWLGYSNGGYGWDAIYDKNGLPIEPVHKPALPDHSNKPKSTTEHIEIVNNEPSVSELARLYTEESGIEDAHDIVHELCDAMDDIVKNMDKNPLNCITCGEKLTAYDYLTTYFLYDKPSCWTHTF